MILEDFFERRLDIGFRDVVVFVKVLLEYIRTRPKRLISIDILFHRVLIHSRLAQDIYLALCPHRSCCHERSNARLCPEGRDFLY